jgi:flavin reductase (DIM6/NTAB) family NADH-FMN oxidoreductase RutF
MTYISVRPERYSYNLIKESGEFVINITTRHLARATDWCGIKSGEHFDKFREMDLTPAPARHVSAPLITESPLNLECKVTEIKKLGSHDMFLAEIVSVNASKAYINSETGKFHIENSDPITYMHGHYYNVGKRIGGFGYTVMKKSTKERLKKQQSDNKKPE